MKTTPKAEPQAKAAHTPGPNDARTQHGCTVTLFGRVNAYETWAMRHEDGKLRSYFLDELRHDRGLAGLQEIVAVLPKMRLAVAKATCAAIAKAEGRTS